MKVKVRKKPAPAVVCGKRANRAADRPFLTNDISSCCNHRNDRLRKKSNTDVYDVNSGDKLVTAIG